MIDVFETDDLDEACDMLNQTYSRMRISATGDRHRLRIAQADIGPVGLHHLSFTMCHSADLPPMGMIPIGRSVSGNSRFQIGGDVIDSTHGHPFLAAQPHREVRADSQDHDGEYARFPLWLFAQIADNTPHCAGQPVRFTGYRPVSAQAATTWNKTYDYVRDLVASTSDEAAPLVVGSAARILAAVTLSTFPNTTLRKPTIEDRHDAHPPALRRAITFIDDNAHHDITPLDIAVAARVSIRSVQLAFRRHLATTPTAHLRSARLENAHRQLLTADPSDTTVSAIAMRWGFASHSSFTAHYRAAYGIPPSQTLRHR